MKIQNLRKETANHDRMNCECALCREYDKAEMAFIRGLHLTTDHASSCYGIPVLVDADGTAYGVSDITPIGEAMPLYHLVAERTGWKLQWEDFGHTLLGGENKNE